MRSVSIKAVLIGGVVDVASSLALGIPFAIFRILRLHQTPMPRGGSASSAVTSLPLYLSELFIGMCCSVLGGYVAARIAKHNELLNGTLSAYLSTILGIFMLAAGLDSHPLYIQALLLASSPVLALSGGYLRLRQKRSQTLPD